VDKKRSWPRPPPSPQPTRARAPASWASKVFHNFRARPVGGGGPNGTSTAKSTQLKPPCVIIAEAKTPISTSMGVGDDGIRRRRPWKKATTLASSLAASATLAVLVWPSVVSGLGLDRCDYDGESATLRCATRSAADKPFEAVDPVVRAAVRRLEIRCTEAFPDVTDQRDSDDVSDGHYASLPRLDELLVERCRVKRLPHAGAFAGGAAPRKLTVRRLPPGASPPEVAAALTGMEAVEVLDLSGAGLWTLPPGALCRLPRLRVLDLSDNHLVEASDAGLGSAAAGGCPSRVEEVNLSGNLLTNLRHGDVAAAGESLRRLMLANNRLSLLGDDALEGLGALQYLDVSSNRLAAVPVGVFANASNLLELNSYNNSLSMLPSGTFDGLSGLTVLNLSSNAIDSALISEESFRGLPALQKLDMSSNRLKELKSGLLKDLPNLKFLSCADNNLEAIESEALTLQSSLEVLDLARNKLAAFSANAFSGLTMLKKLSLDGNHLATLPEDILRDSLELEDLSLDGNALESVPAAIARLNRLRTLDLGENRIRQLQADDFSALSNLYGLRLSGNQLESLSGSHFANNTVLHVLNLARNRLSAVERDTFSSLKDLRALRLDNNQLADMNGLLSSLTKLQWLNVSSNRLQWFDYAFVPPSLEWLDLRQNRIEELGNYYKLEVSGGRGETFGLRTLHAGGNRIKGRLTRLSLPSGLEAIDLSDNLVEGVEEGVFEDMPSLVSVDLSGNRIERLEIGALLVREGECAEMDCLVP